MPNTQWEKEFDEILKPPKYNKDLEGTSCVLCGWSMPNSRGAELLKSFIRKQFSGLASEIEELRKDVDPKNFPTFPDDFELTKNEGYNESISDILFLIKNRL